MPCGDAESREKRVKRKEAVDFHINETTLTETNKPADFSFHALIDLKLLGCENARTTRLGEPPEKHPTSKKFLTKGLWLNNNKLVKLTGLDTFVANIIDKPELLTLMDFSFNRLTGIHDVVATFKNLAVLYFHGNNIEDPYELVKLHNLKKLRNVTFHGNPVSESPYYRQIIMICMPTIVHLDHRPILKSERKQPAHPNALELMRSYQKAGKRRVPGEPFKMQNVALSKRPEHCEGNSEGQEGVCQLQDCTPCDPQKADAEKTVSGESRKAKELQRIKIVPGITSEFIKKRDGICRCCKSCTYKNLM